MYNSIKVLYSRDYNSYGEIDILINDEVVISIIDNVSNIMKHISNNFFMLNYERGNYDLFIRFPLKRDNEYVINRAMVNSFILYEDYDNVMINKSDKCMKLTIDDKDMFELIINDDNNINIHKKLSVYLIKDSFRINE